jgi:homoserine kinase
MIPGPADRAFAVDAAVPDRSSDATRDATVHEALADEALADEAPLPGGVRVQVAATSANLGPGFDSLGLALGLWDVIEARFVQGAEVVVEVIGEGAGRVPTDAGNLVAEVVRTGLATFDETGDLATRGLFVRCRNTIPHSRGLGSSAAAIVGGLTVAARLAGVAEGLTTSQLVALGTRLEGHPDNVAAGVLGGATIAWMEHADAGPVGRATRFDVHPDVAPVVIIPPQQASTVAARNALPPTVEHADAAFTAGRSALLVHALSQDPALLLTATDDRLHQQHRRCVYPASMDLVDRLRSQGVAAAISGAGPTVIAFAVDGDGRALAARLTGSLDRHTQVLVPGITRVGVADR